MHDIPYFHSILRPLLDNGLKGGNSETPERASICNHFGVCLSVCLCVCLSAYMSVCLLQITPGPFLCVISF